MGRVYEHIQLSYVRIHGTFFKTYQILISKKLLILMYLTRKGIKLRALVNRTLPL